MQAWLILLLSAVFAGFMKLADLAEEHGVKFKFGMKYLFSIIWGLAGALCVASGNVAVASYFVALMFNYILRFRVDTFTHGLSTVITLFPLVMSGIVKVSINLIIFLTCFIIMSGFGYIHDRLDDSEKIRKFLLKNKFLYLFFEYRAFYYTLFIFVAIVFKEWLLFAIPVIGMGTYEIVRQLGEKTRKEK
jgi:hypothetical protein